MLIASLPVDFSAHHLTVSRWSGFEGYPSKLFHSLDTRGTAYIANRWEKCRESAACQRFSVARRNHGPGKCYDPNY